MLAPVRFSAAKNTADTTARPPSGTIQLRKAPARAKRYSLA
jgi:hypothetical protein